MQSQLVSIITPMYNGGTFVSQTIETVLNQTYPNWEMIIVNDGSKDDSPEIVSEFSKKDSRIRLINQPNGGSASARNNGLRNAKGRFICFLDSDDLWEPVFLEEQINFLTENNASIVSASYNRINDKNDKILKPFIIPARMRYSNILKTCSLSCLTTLYDKNKIGDVFFDESLMSMRDDHAFWLSLLKKTDFALGNKKVLASYRMFVASTTANKKKVMIPQFNIYYKIEKLGLIRSTYYFIHWAINGYIKYL